MSESYNFTTTGEGSFDFEGDNTFYIVKPDNSIGVVYASTPDSALNTQVVGNLAIARRDAAPPHLTKRATFVGCTAARQTLINTAAASAETYAANTYRYACFLIDIKVYPVDKRFQ